jgi:HD-GYP domain-containing protein (c-di-GMP phosphodiesterase class II)
LGRPASVPARELARWLGLDARWLEGQAAAGRLPADVDPHGYLVDPRVVADWIAAEEPNGATETPTATRGDLETLRTVSLALARGDAPEVVCSRVLDRLVGDLEADCGAIFLSEEDAWLRLAASKGFPEDDLPQVLEGVAVWVAANAEPLLLPDPRRSSVVPEAAHHDDPRDALAVPFLVAGRVLGVFVVMRRSSAPSFGDRHLTLALVLATEFALAIERARIERTLGRQLDQAHKQLEAYAVDVRTTFEAEKARTRQLVDALSELERTYLATVRGLAAAVEAKDSYTAGHLHRVTRYGQLVIRTLAPELVDDPQVEYGFLLHDIGKLGVPDVVLGKPGSLDDGEWELMRRHPEIGRRIIGDIPFLMQAREIVYSHHERWDGRGYPRGLDRTDIPLGARIFGVVDAFDAMTTDRPYRAACSVNRAREELDRGSGTQFWPDAVEAFLSIPTEELVRTSNARIEWIPSGDITRELFL